MESRPESHRRALALARRLNVVPEPGMRKALLAKVLNDEPATEVAAALHELLSSSRAQPNLENARALETLVAALAEPGLVAYEARAEIYSAAKRAGHDTVARMLFELPTSMDEGDDGGDRAAERPLVPRGRPLTLGERKSLARGQRRDILTKLLTDPHPAVIELLLSNPHLCEQDVVAIATRRTAEPGALALIAASSKWSVRRGVKRALVLNPRTPPHLALRLATTLGATDLRFVAEDGNLPELLRAQARALLRSAYPSRG